MAQIERLKPANRHILIIPKTEENKTETGVLLPDDYKPLENRYIEAVVIDIAADCDKQFKDLKYSNMEIKKVVVDKSMIEKVDIRDRTYHLILENYVVGIFGRDNDF
tara:strand:+ start:1537 stop:1857 length:321 start_codon:yes stop_codon:yes gene_type:complete